VKTSNVKDVFTNVKKQKKKKKKKKNPSQSSLSMEVRVLFSILLSLLIPKGILLPRVLQLWDMGYKKIQTHDSCM
jgi:hypothetical protein